MNKNLTEFLESVKKILNNFTLTILKIIDKLNVSLELDYDNIIKVKITKKDTIFSDNIDV